MVVTCMDKYMYHNAYHPVKRIGGGRGIEQVLGKSAAPAAITGPSGRRRRVVLATSTAAVPVLR